MFNILDSENKNKLNESDSVKTLEWKNKIEENINSEKQDLDQLVKNISEQVKNCFGIIIDFYFNKNFKKINEKLNLKSFLEYNEIIDDFKI